MVAVVGEIAPPPAAQPMPIEHGTAMPNGPVAYPPTAVLTAEQTAAMIQVSMRTFERLDIPCSYLVGRGKRQRSMRRYVVADVLDYLKRQKSA